MFYLPFREHGEHSRASASHELARQFDVDMQPETVLFLRNLTSIIVSFPVGVNQQIKQYTRKTNGVEVMVAEATTLCSLQRVTDEYGRTQQQWVPMPPTVETHVYRRGSVHYEVPLASREARRNYESTEVMLAFPVREDGQPNLDRKNHVFAFLPVRSFGFRVCDGVDPSPSGFTTAASCGRLPPDAVGCRQLLLAVAAPPRCWVESVVRRLCDPGRFPPRRKPRGHH